MKRLQELRKEHAMSQQKLADKIGVSRSTIAMWETTASQPDNRALQQLADLFAVSIDYLLCRSADKNGLTRDEGAPLDVESLEYALYGAARELDEDEKKQLLDLANLMRKKRREKP